MSRKRPQRSLKAKTGFIGAGIGAWDITHGDMVAPVLVVQGRKGESQLVFKDGYIVSANHVDNHIRIGNLLVEQSVLTEDQLHLALLDQNEVDIVFAPSEAEMYPEPDNRVFDFGNIDKVMEGAHRPGHFNGVAQIVSKLFVAVEPDKAYFGDKDFQQVAVIKQMVRQLNLPVAIVPCPIVREADGLAMSSRNTLLSPVQRQHAVLISKTLFESREMAKTIDVKELKAWVVANINKDPELEVEYFEIVDDTDLISAKS